MLDPTEQRHELDDDITSGSDDDEDLIRRPANNNTFYKPDYKRLESNKHTPKDSSRINAEGLYQPPKTLQAYRGND